MNGVQVCEVHKVKHKKYAIGQTKKFPKSSAAVLVNNVQRLQVRCSVDAERSTNAANPIVITSIPSSSAATTSTSSPSSRSVSRSHYDRATAANYSTVRCSPAAVEHKCCRKHNATSNDGIDSAAISTSTGQRWRWCSDVGHGSHVPSSFAISTPATPASSTASTATSTSPSAATATSKRWHNPAAYRKYPSSASAAATTTASSPSAARPTPPSTVPTSVASPSSPSSVAAPFAPSWHHNGAA